MQDMVWFTADGRGYLISQMQTNHILNCIRKIRRQGNWRVEYLERLELEIEIRNLKK